MGQIASTIEIVSLLACCGIFAWSWKTRADCEEMLKKKVDISSCRIIHENMDKRFNDLKEHIDKRMDDLNQRLDNLIQTLMKK